MAVLPTNYLDDILAASMGGKRRFRITHEDGSTEEVTLEDVSEYEQVGSPFGSGDVNKTNQAVNEKLDSADVVDPALATVLGFAADAKLTGDALSELNKKTLYQIGDFSITEYTNKEPDKNSYYVIKSGICIVNLTVLCNTVYANENLETGIILPIPFDSKYAFGTLNCITDNGVMIAGVTKNGALYVRNGLANKTFIGSFSYVV